MLPALPEQPMHPQLQIGGVPVSKQEPSRMRTSLIFRAAVSCGLLGMAAATWFTSAYAAEELPSLSSAISSGEAQVWSAGDPAATLVGPALSGDYLSPIPMNDADLAAGGVGAEQPCSSCNGGASNGLSYNRCGCTRQVFPWIRGPGNCDNWCVGPHWNVELDGMFIHRDNADWSRVVNNVGLTPDLLDQFQFGPGVRLFATGYNYNDYGVQVGYEGVNDFHATALFTNRSIQYESALNSVEANIIRKTPTPLKVFAGARIVDIREDYTDLNTVSTDSNRFQVENLLMGFQIGAFRDAWQLNRWLTFEPYGNAGAYYNNFKRENIVFTSGTTTAVQRDFSEIAFLGEAGLNAIVRLNRCCALRAGYQAMVFSGVGEGLDAAFAQGLDPTTVLYHGVRFGVEYSR
jgi:hypothetical protein